MKLPIDFTLRIFQNNPIRSKKNIHRSQSPRLLMPERFMTTPASTGVTWKNDLGKEV